MRADIPKPHRHHTHRGFVAAVFGVAALVATAIGGTASYYMDQAHKTVEGKTAQTVFAPAHKL